MSIQPFMFAWYWSIAFMVCLFCHYSTIITELLINVNLINPGDLIERIRGVDLACELLGPCTMSAIRKQWDVKSVALPLYLIKPIILAIAHSAGKIRDASACDKCKVWQGLYIFPQPALSLKMLSYAIRCYAGRKCSTFFLRSWRCWRYAWWLTRRRFSRASSMRPGQCVAILHHTRRNAGMETRSSGWRMRMICILLILAIYAQECANLQKPLLDSSTHCVCFNPVRESYQYRYTSTLPPPCTRTHRSINTVQWFHHCFPHAGLQSTYMPQRSSSFSANTFNQTLFVTQ